ncbi:MAG: MFS transporter [Anaerolineae bacterium]|nr:MFS transporter [Anaerolineae bacterium]
MERIRLRIVSALFVAQILFTAANIAAFTLSPIIAADLGGGDGYAGLPSTLSLLGRAALAYPAGWLMDRAGRRLGLSLGFFVGVAGAILSALAVRQGSLPLFLAAAFALGGMRAAGEQSRYVGAEIFPRERRARVIGLIVFAGTIGAVGGPLLVAPGTKLALGLAYPDVAGPFIVAAILAALALSLLFVFLRPDPLQLHIALESHDARPAGPAPRIRDLLREPAVSLGLLALAIGQLVMVLLMVLTPLHMNHHAHSNETISLVIMAHTLGMFGLSWLTGGLVERFGRHAVIALGAVLLAVSALLTPLVSGVPLLALALFLLGLGWNFCFVAGSALVAGAAAGSAQARLQGTTEMVAAVASGAGSLPAGLLYSWSAMLVPGIVGVLLSVLLLAALGWYRRLPVAAAPT